jgi:hypothetical protein
VTAHGAIQLILAVTGFAALLLVGAGIEELLARHRKTDDDLRTQVDAALGCEHIAPGGRCPRGCHRFTNGADLMPPAPRRKEHR